MSSKNLFISLNRELLEGGLNIQRKLGPEEERMLNYRNGLRAAVIRESRIYERDFFEALDSLYSKTDIPLLKSETSVRLYIKFTHNKAIMDCLMFLAKQFKGKKYTRDTEFWEKCLSNLMLSSKENLKTKRHQLKLFAEIAKHLLNRFPVGQLDVCFRYVLDHSIESVLFCIQKYGIGHGFHNHRLPFSVNTDPLLRCFEVLDRHDAPSELYEILLMNLLPEPQSSVLFKENFCTFFAFLFDRIPIDKIKWLSMDTLERLFFIYEINAQVFEKVEYAKMEEEFRELLGSKPMEPNRRLDYQRFMIESLFRAYKISFYFAHNFCSNSLNPREKEWLVGLLEGKNLIYAKDLPFKLTKVQAHEFNFQTYPAWGVSITFSVSEGLVKFALEREIHNPTFVNALIRRMRDMSRSAFWIKTTMSLVKNGLTADTPDLDELYDYINYQVFQLNRNIDFSQKKLINLRREAHTWHNNLMLVRNYGYRGLVKLPSLGIAPFKVEVKGKNYVLKQLKTNMELIEEGTELKHCVGTYTRNCLKFGSYIFSLRELVENLESEELDEVRMVTIEVNRKRIVQKKGLRNRSCDAVENHVIDLWRFENGLVA
ncbi:MAG: PcfJ domain-containing protein [Bacteroidota bacterium]